MGHVAYDLSLDMFCLLSYINDLHGGIMFINCIKWIIAVPLLPLALLIVLGSVPFGRSDQVGNWLDTVLAYMFGDDFWYGK